MLKISNIDKSLATMIKKKKKAKIIEIGNKGREIIIKLA